MTEDENGNYVFNYTIAQDKMNEYLSDALEGMDELVGDTGSYTIGDDDRYLRYRQGLQCSER